MWDKMSQSLAGKDIDDDSKKDNLDHPKPNKSTLHTLLGNTKLIRLPSPEDKEPIDLKAEGEKKVQKNISTLYKIISSQNILVNGRKEEEEEEEEATEYEDIIDNQHFEKENQMSIAENAIYYVDENKEAKRRHRKDSERKKSSIEITVTPAVSDRSKRAQSAIESPKPSRHWENGFSIRKTHSSNISCDLGDFSGIRFSFLDEKPNEKSRDLIYDTIDESKNFKMSPEDYVVMAEGSENPYSSPRTSLDPKTRAEGVGHEDYVFSDRTNSDDHKENDSELFYAASEVFNLRPPTPFRRRKESSDYEDLESELLPDIPQKAANQVDDYADVDANDYCRHREEHQKKFNSKEKKTIVRVRSKINRAWKSMKSWVNEEREAKEGGCTRSPRVEAIEIVRGSDGGATEPEQEVNEVTRTSLIPETPVFRFSNENMHFLDLEKKEASLSDSGTYVDMTRSLLSESAGDLFFTLLRKKRETNAGTPSLRKSRSYPEGQNGFEELRKYIKQGGDFCKELSVILQERSEAENQYAKNLSKLSHKLLKTSKDAVGSVSEAWQRLGAEMEVQSEIHRTFATALNEEVVKPLKRLLESQHRVRKNVEGIVDKTGKTLTEWRQAESKSKKQSFLCARENEKLQDAMLEVRNNRNASSLHLHHHNQRNLSDKESAKLDLKKKKAEESMKKADVEYYGCCVRAERSRLDWESAVTRGSHCFQILEEERLTCLKNLALVYLEHLKEVGPKLVQSCDRVTEAVETCDVTRDIRTVAAMKGSGQSTQEQLLPDFYAEHVTLAMNRERRRRALVKLLQLIRQDLERERRGKEGVENLQRALQQTPNFGAEESQQNVDEKLYHTKSMLVYLEAARYKVQTRLDELDGCPKMPHPLASHIHVTRDRQGLQQSVLRVPYWAKNESAGDRGDQDSPTWTGREAGDGTSNQPDSDFDEFSSVESDKDYQGSVCHAPVISDCDCDSDANKAVIGQCRALYEYSAKVYDELNLRIGDVIKIHDKRPDGWWLGELDGVVGIFPATYVEEIHETTP